MVTRKFLCTWQWNDHSTPMFGLRIPVPFTNGDWSFTFYFRHRPYRLQKQENAPFVIDWPWIRYTGWHDSKGNRIHRNEVAYLKVNQ